jgi:hypothetical protein
VFHRNDLVEELRDERPLEHTVEVGTEILECRPETTFARPIRLETRSSADLSQGSSRAAARSTS